MLHFRGTQTATKAERADLYREYAEELRATSQILQSHEAREILLKTASEYERMAAAIAKMNADHDKVPPGTSFH